MSNLDDFIIHSQYPVEKTVWTAEGVNDQTNPHWHETDWGGLVFEPFPDELNFNNILIDGVWTNDDWQTSYRIASNSKVMGYYETGGSYSLDYDWLDVSPFPKGVDVWGYVLPTNCMAFFGGSSTGQRTLKYKVWAYMAESDWESSTTTKTAETLAYKLQKDTRLAQLNMVSESILQVPLDQTRVLYHNLGFRPFCKMWCRSIYADEGASGWGANLYDITGIPLSSSLIRNSITIDSEKITITAHDENDPEHLPLRYDFLIRIYNYAIPQ